MSTKTIFFCSECGYESVQWHGKCPSCKQWNTIKEAKFAKSDKKTNGGKNIKEYSKPKAEKISEVQSAKHVRIQLASSELNRVLGGGLVTGSVVLVSGEPGIGKSTLFLQLALRQDESSILYVSGEESLEQIKLRGERLNKTNDDVYLYNGTSTDEIIEMADEIQPSYIVIDSIQTIKSPMVETSVGSISQIREASAELIEYAKNKNVGLFLIGHINKDGNIAGPKLLEHMVDVVLHFEGDRHNNYRIIRTNKNRFGSTNEIGVYEMGERGLIEVKNISALLLSVNDYDASGNAVASITEGSRALMIDTQSLVTESSYGQPQRTASGFEQRRLQLLLAVLEKRAGFNFAQKDVFLNIAGNLKTEDPGVDLAVCAALISSYRDAPILSDICFCGEVGLSGEVRPVPRIELKISEAEKLGFKKMVISKNTKLPKKKYNIVLLQINSIDELDKII